MSLFPRTTEALKETRSRGDKDENKTLSRVLEILAPSGFDAVLFAFEDKGIKVGQVYTDPVTGQIPDAALKCIDWDVRTIAPPTPGDVGLFEVSFSYGSSPGSGPGLGGVKPTPGGPPVYYWDAAIESVNKFVDYNGNPILNSRGEPSRNGIPTLVPVLTLEVQRYVSSYDLSLMVAYSGAINSDNWKGLVPSQAICMGIKPDPVGDGLWLESLRFNMRKDGYDSPVPDEDSEGNLLNGTGGLLGTNTISGQPPAGIIKTINAGGGVLFVWRAQEPRPFSALGV